MSKNGKVILWTLIIGLTIFVIIRRKQIMAKLRELRVVNAPDRISTAPKNNPNAISNAPRNNPNSIAVAEVAASFNCDLCTSANMDPSSAIPSFDAATGRYVMPNGREAIKCCTSRDANCHCLSWKWKASSDCATVACGSSSAGSMTQAPKPQIYFNPQTNTYYQQLMNYSTPHSSASSAGGSSAAASAGVIGK